MPDNINLGHSDQRLPILPNGRAEAHLSDELRNNSSWQPSSSFRIARAYPEENVPSFSTCNPLVSVLVNGEEWLYDINMQEMEEENSLQREEIIETPYYDNLEHYSLHSAFEYAQEVCSSSSSFW